MEYRKAYLKEFTRNLEEMTGIFVNALGIEKYKIFFCAINYDVSEITCFRKIDEKAKKDIDNSLCFFDQNTKNTLYYGNNYLVTNRMICFKYLDGDFIVAFWYESGLKNENSRILNLYFKTQIENYLTYTVPIILHKSPICSKFLIEGQINAVTKTIIESIIQNYDLNEIGISILGNSYYYEIIDELSVMTYEGEYLKNKCLIFTREEQNCDIEIINNINLNEAKKVRKLLEITHYKKGEECLGLLYSREKKSISGFVLEKNIKGNYIKIKFQDKGKWIIYINIDNMEDELTIINSKAYVSDETKIIKKFESTYKQLFGDCNIKCAVDLIKKARLQEHGTMLVFSDHASNESERLNSVGYEIICSKTNGMRFMKQITTIDGSIFIEPEGSIVGIGIILDGEASDECEINNSRGSRYNSAIKYTYTRSKKQEKCIAIVISEDKDVNIIMDEKQF